MVRAFPAPLLLHLGRVSGVDARLSFARGRSVTGDGSAGHLARLVVAGRV